MYWRMICRLGARRDGRAIPMARRVRFVAWLGACAFLLSRRQSAATDAATALSWRYPLTELTLALLFLVTRLLTRNDASIALERQLIYLAYLAIFVLLALVDIEHRRILLLPLGLAAALALADAAFYGHSS